MTKRFLFIALLSSPSAPAGVAECPLTNTLSEAIRHTAAQKYVDRHLYPTKAQIARSIEQFLARVEDRAIRRLARKIKERGSAIRFHERLEESATTAKISGKRLERTLARHGRGLIQVEARELLSQTPQPGKLGDADLALKNLSDRRPWQTTSWLGLAVLVSFVGTSCVHTRHHEDPRDRQLNDALSSLNQARRQNETLEVRVARLMKVLGLDPAKDLDEQLLTREMGSTMVSIGCVGCHQKAMGDRMGLFHENGAPLHPSKFVGQLEDLFINHLRAEISAPDAHHYPTPMVVALGRLLNQNENSTKKRTAVLDWMTAVRRKDAVK